MNLPQKLGGGGENCTPDYLLCGQMPCCLGYAAFENEYDAACESALARKRARLIAIASAAHAAQRLRLRQLAAVVKLRLSISCRISWMDLVNTLPGPISIN